LGNRTPDLRITRSTASRSDALPAQIAALASRNALCAQSARIPGPRTGPRPGQPLVTECYQLGLGSPNTRPPVSRPAHTRTAPVPDLALTETLAQIADYLRAQVSGPRCLQCMQICPLGTCLNWLPMTGAAGHVFKGDVGGGAHVRLGSPSGPGLAPQAAGMSGSGGRSDRAGRLRGAAWWSWIPMLSGRRVRRSRRCLGCHRPARVVR
jgi:hypothetical protein